MNHARSRLAAYIDLYGAVEARCVRLRDGLTVPVDASPLGWTPTGIGQVVSVEAGCDSSGVARSASVIRNEIGYE